MQTHCGAESNVDGIKISVNIYWVRRSHFFFVNNQSNWWNWNISLDDSASLNFYLLAKMQFDVIWIPMNCDASAISPHWLWPNRVPLSNHHGRWPPRCDADRKMDPIPYLQRVNSIPWSMWWPLRSYCFVENAVQLLYSTVECFVRAPAHRCAWSMRSPTQSSDQSFSQFYSRLHASHDDRWSADAISPLLWPMHRTEQSFVLVSIVHLAELHTNKEREKENFKVK